VTFPTSIVPISSIQRRSSMRWRGRSDVWRTAGLQARIFVADARI
jgi:hypothetical protein